MKQPRPVNLNLLTIRFPITAITSILHRISGVILFLLIPLFLWMLQMSLTSPTTYNTLIDELALPSAKPVFLVLLASLIYHLLAGIRHLFMDVHIGDSKAGGTLGAKIVIGASIVLTLLAGVYIW